ncbi:hypothetical protein [Nocardia farcinica]|uniref:Uncharacterized protein n=1 Tax=Nocardia farcinica (strain IFM 10152) TaxID=247156 RepID=Q5Z3V4_NOCFA|nr:hypothetical protein [Nocardia farcinica]BAD54887.1 hypothetical protein NFA_450 [Nocardia farcinica IFM 10152]
MTTPLPSLLSLEAYNTLVAGTGIEQMRLAAIVRDIRDYCGWHIAPAVEQTLVVDGSGATVQPLPTLRLNSITEVKENGHVLATDGFEWSHDGTLRRATPWTSRLRGIEATVNHGHDAVPENIVSVILDAASAALSLEVGEGAAAGPETMGPFSFGASEGGVTFTAAQRRVLDRYRIEKRA